MPPRVVLVGAPGAGKTAVGRRLAERLRCAFRDTDEDVERSAGATVADVFLDEGESGFRQREREALDAALDGHDGVLALGGGAVEDAANRARLSGIPVVWLRVRASQAAKRVGISAPRPLLLGNVRTEWAAQLKRREPLYAEVADYDVATDSLAPDDVAARIAQFLEGRGAP